jgi:uncharacterized membrane-anchored protein
VLRKNKEGIHEYSGYYYLNGWNKPYKKQLGDIVINGIYHDSFVEYGIEHFFIEEGTGRKYEEGVKFAYVKIGKNGDAILTKLHK